MKIYISKDLSLVINSVKNNASTKTSHFLATLIKNNQGVKTYTPVEFSSYNPKDWDVNFLSNFPHQSPENWTLCSPVRLDLVFKKQFGSILPFYNLAGVTPPEIIDPKSSSIELPSLKYSKITQFQKEIFDDPELDAINHIKLMTLHCVEKKLQDPDDITTFLENENLLNLSEVQELKYEASKNLDVSKNDLYLEVEAFFSS